MFYDIFFSERWTLSETEILREKKGFPYRILDVMTDFSAENTSLHDITFQITS